MTLYNPMCFLLSAFGHKYLQLDRPTAFDKKFGQGFRSIAATQKLPKQ